MIILGKIIVILERTMNSIEEWFVETYVNWDYFWFYMEGKFLSIMIIFWLIIYIGWRHK